MGEVIRIHREFVHDEQFEIWAHEIVQALNMSEMLKESPSYDDVVVIHKIVKDEIARAFETVFPQSDTSPKGGE